MRLSQNMFFRPLLEDHAEFRVILPLAVGATNPNSDVIRDRERFTTVFALASGPVFQRVGAPGPLEQHDKPLIVQVAVDIAHPNPPATTDFDPYEFPASQPIPYRFGGDLEPLGDLFRREKRDHGKIRPVQFRPQRSIYIVLFEKGQIRTRNVIDLIFGVRGEAPGEKVRGEAPRENTRRFRPPMASWPP